jgi:hypothetical protein
MDGGGVKRERRPWFVDMSSPMRILEDDVRQTIICEIPTAASNEEAREDAKLIAAAPDLLSALIALERASLQMAKIINRTRDEEGATVKKWDVARQAVDRARTAARGAIAKAGK